MNTCFKTTVSFFFLSVLVATSTYGDSSLSPRTHVEDLSQAFRNIYKDVSPAVVLIRTTPGRVAVNRVMPRFHPDVPKEMHKFNWLGSGTLVSSDGYVLSNHHVTHGADSISIVLSDRRAFPAKVVGSDSLIDISVLKIEANDLPVVPFGQAEKLRIGDWVLAIGHPLGLGSTLTHGIVSALGRQAEVIPANYAIESFIQTNAVINPGNSGGPLLNLDGELIGINTAISTRTGYYIGYGLAVPIDLVQEAMRDILKYGRSVRGYIGISMQDVDQALVETAGLQGPIPRGVFINGVDENSPADAADLRQGDVLLAIGKQEVNVSNHVQTLIYARDPGDRVLLTVVRDRDTLGISVTLGEPEHERLLAEGRTRLSQLGLRVEHLSDGQALEIGFTREIAADLGFSDGEKPVAVVEIDDGGPAAEKGVQLFDIITEIDREHVTSTEHLFELISMLETDKSALFWIWRKERGVDVRALRIRNK